MSDPLAILTDLATQLEVAHRRRENAMARFPLFPNEAGHSVVSARYPAGLSTRRFPLPFLTGSFPVPSTAPTMAGWEFAEHPTEALLKKLLWNLMSLNVGEFGRTVADSHRQLQAVARLQNELDRTSGFVSRYQRVPGGAWYEGMSMSSPDTRAFEGRGIPDLKDRIGLTDLERRIGGAAGDALGSLMELARRPGRLAPSAAGGEPEGRPGLAEW